ncbi:DUF3320 domain-containing protein [Amnibacterium soli]|uniref:DUF3320 domain-containing protein n=1 Tax=Amnibacterium soli TaxID=1282736 RepID=A0ABP8YYK7_9MICO
MGEVEIEIQHVPVVSFAGTHNGASVVQELSIRSANAVLEDVDVTVSLESLGQQMAETWAQRVPRVGPVATRWNDLKFRLDAAALFALDDQREADLRVRVVQGGVVLAEMKRDVQLLAANTWVWTDPPEESALTLAAFVTPNHPALRSVLDLTVDRLRSSGQNSGLSGYQDPGHVLPMVEALYESVRGIGLTYVDPPASWDLSDTRGRPLAQRIRTPGEVLGERVGTCIDTASLFAALLENIGLKPVLALVPGHAFVGLWTKEREEFAFPDPVMPLAAVINHVDEGNIALFETTTVCGGPDSAPFAVALEKGRQRISEKEALRANAASSRFVDVAQARWKRRVLPIPARVVLADGRVEVVEYKPQELSISLLQKALAEEGAGTRAGLRQMETPVRIRRWKDALLDLSFRNPLINYRSPAGSSLGLFLPPGSLGTIEDLLQTGHELSVGPSQFQAPDGRFATLDQRGQFDSNLNSELVNRLVAARQVFTTATPDTFLTRVRRIASLSKVGREDNGVNDLYLGLGMLHWQPEGRTEAVRSPLILIPVVLKPYNRSREFRLAIDETGTVTPNFSLAEKLSQDVGLKLPKLVEPDLDDAGVDIDRLIAYVREEITKAGLQHFRVDESAVLGFFDFSTYRLWRDLSDHWPAFLDSPLVKHLVETPNVEFEDPSKAADSIPEDLDDLASQLPIAVDGSQATAIARAMSGETFVLQGPPGTGKSQTITNLLARGLHQGKRILFIAEKPAALSVVKDRLESVGLTSFCLDLHDKGMRPAAVRQQLAEVMDLEVLADRDGFESAGRELARSLSPLQSYPRRLHARGAFGESVYSARSKLLSNRATRLLPVESAFVARGDATARRRVMESLLELADVGESAGIARTNPWSLATISGSDIDASLEQRVSHAVDAIASGLSSLFGSREGASYLAEVESLDEIVSARELIVASSFSIAVIDAAVQPDQRAARSAAMQELSMPEETSGPVPVAPTAIDAPVDELQEHASSARGSFFIGRKKRVAAVCREVEAFLPAGTALPPEALEDAIRSLAEAQRGARNTRSRWLAVQGAAIDAGANPLVPEDRAAALRSLRALDRAVAVLADDGTAARRRFRSLASAGHEVVNTASALAMGVAQLVESLAVTETSTRLWTGDERIGNRLATTSVLWQRDRTERGFTQLRRWAALHDSTAPLRAAGLLEAERSLLAGDLPYREADEAFERGLLEGVLRRQFDDERLDAFDGPVQDAAVRSFQRASQDLERAVPGVIAADIVDSRGFRSGVGVGAVGELRREINKVRRGKPIRRLLADHWDVIQRLTPCVLASPDSVARFLPADLGKFDLVVFDEASQIKVPHSIGALGRARSAIVVGDSKQMPPTSVAELSRAEDDDLAADDEPTIDEESILSESLQARIPDLLLSWHYRSEDESLIAFSNQLYYDGRLSTFPAASTAVADKGLSFVKVDGQFLGGAGARTNPAEAQAIVAEIVRRLHDPVLRRHSIGVVTFNKPQQLLILEMLQSLDDELVQEALERSTEEGILVRNLESVQGQERDVVLFSVAFSKNANGVLPTNFGPLNRVGGERRLNVAVTRARRQVVVFCSFEPHELQAERSASVGLRHLRSYLELARSGPEASGAVSARAPKPADRHRDEILDALRGAGLVCEPDVGLSDFKVDIAVMDPRDPNRRLLALLLDGEQWSKRSTSGDRDSLPAQILVAKMGWPAVDRIWLPTWLRDRANEVERIRDRVAELSAAALPGAQPAVEAVNIAAPRPPVVQREQYSAAPAPALNQALDWSHIPTWSAWPLQVVGQAFILDQLRDPSALRHLQDLAEFLVSVEGPLSPARFGRLVGQAHGMQRVPTKRVQEIAALPIPRLHRDHEGFLFPADAPPAEFARWLRSEPGTGRAVEDISLAELGNAMSDVARAGLGMSADDLVRLTAQGFGIGRVTVGIRARLDTAMQQAIKAGKLAHRGDHVVAPEVLA